MLSMTLCGQHGGWHRRQRARDPPRLGRSLRSRYRRRLAAGPCQRADVRLEEIATLLLQGRGLLLQPGEPQARGQYLLADMRARLLPSKANPGLHLLGASVQVRKVGGHETQRSPSGSTGRSRAVPWPPACSSPPTCTLVSRPAMVSATGSGTPTPASRAAGASPLACPVCSRGGAAEPCQRISWEASLAGVSAADRSGLSETPTLLRPVARCSQPARRKSRLTASFQNRSW